MSSPLRDAAPSESADDGAAALAESFVAEVEEADRLAPALLRVRQGTPAARKQVLRQLSRTPHVRSLLELAISAIEDEDVPDVERHRMLKLVSRVLLRGLDSSSARAVTSLAKPLLRIAQTLILDDDRVVRASGQELLTSLSHVVGLRALLEALRPSFDTADDRTRQACAVSIASIAFAFGIPLLLPLMRALTNDDTRNVRFLGLLTLRRLPARAGNGILPFLSSLVDCCLPSLSDAHFSSAACAALRAFAETVSPFGIEAFEPSLDLLWNGLRRRNGRPASAFLRTLATLVPLVDPSEATDFAAPLLAHAAQDYSSIDSEIRRTAVVVTRLCVATASPPVIADLLTKLFDHAWTRQSAEDHYMAALVVRTTSELPTDYSKIVAELVNRNILVSDNLELQIMGFNLLTKMSPAPLLISRRQEERLMDGLIAAPPVAAAVHAISNVAQSLGPERLGAHARTWVRALMEQQAHPEPEQRQFGAQIIKTLAPELPQPELRILQRHLSEQLGEEYPDVLAQLLNALKAVVAAVDDASASDPPMSTLIPRVSPILRNRNESVQEACIQLMNSLAEIGGESVSAREWINVCFELLQLQSSHRVTVRRLATSTFAMIASIIGPQDVVISLLGQLRANDRQLRVTSAAAIAAVGAQTEPFTVLPIVLNEYRSLNITVQHGVLKTLAFLFEFIERGQAAAYVESVVTIVDHALLEQDQVHRQTAANIVQHLALGCVGHGKEAIFVHFLNELMPSIFETSPHVIDRVLEALEAIHVAIGTPAMVNYFWPGLFHPARKVRTAYWNIWNLLYVHNSDALVPFYPVTVPSPDDENEDVRDLWV